MRTKFHTLSSEGLLELDAPFSLGAVHLEHGYTHDEDHKTRDQLEDTWEGKGHG